MNDRDRANNMKPPRRRRVACAMAMAAATAFVAACGSTSKSSATGGSKANTVGSSGTTAGSSAGVAQAQAYVEKYLVTPTSIPVTIPLKSAPPTGKLAVSLTDTETPQSATISAGLEQAAQAIGWNYRSISFQSSNPATMQAAFQTALQFHPAMVLEPSVPQSEWGANTISDYAKAGVYIVPDAQYPCTSSAYVLCSPNGYDPIHEAGVLVAAWFVSDSNGHGSALVEHVPSFPILNAFTSGFQSEVSQLCPACAVSLENVTIPQVTAGSVPGILVSALRKKPATKYLIFDDGPFSNGIESALRAAGLSDVKVAGESAATQQFQNLRNGTDAAWSAQNTYYQSWAAMDMVLRKMEGMPADPEDLQMPLELLTKSTIGNTTTNWTEPANGLADFEQLWHVGS